MDRPVLTAEEAKLSYAKYFNRPLAPIPQEKLNIWKGPMAPAASALPFAERARFQDADVPGMDNGFTVAPETHSLYHGEKVAFGTLTQLVLEKAPQEELEQVLSFLKDTGLPMTLTQLGVAEVVPETLHKVAEAACVPTQSTKNLRADITAQEVYDAILEADRLGREWLAR